MKKFRLCYLSNSANNRGCKYGGCENILNSDQKDILRDEVYKIKDKVDSNEEAYWFEHNITYEDSELEQDYCTISGFKVILEDIAEGIFGKDIKCFIRVNIHNQSVVINITPETEFEIEKMKYKERMIEQYGENYVEKLSVALRQLYNVE